MCITYQCHLRILLPFPDFLLYPLYYMSQRTYHTMDTPSPFTASCLCTYFSVRILTVLSCILSPYVKCLGLSDLIVHLCTHLRNSRFPRSDLPSLLVTGKEPALPCFSAHSSSCQVRIPSKSLQTRWDFPVPRRFEECSGVFGHREGM